MIEKRGIGLAILLTIVTCGIYGIYWFIKITDESNALSGEQYASGGMSFLLTIVTFGIYGFFWSYNMGKKLMGAQQNAGMVPSDNSILYILLTVFGLQIVVYCIAQSEINKLVGNGNVAA